ELIQLSMKGSKVVPSPKPTLICMVWTKKLYNPESFKAQIKSIWKTRKKFEIQMVGQNLFLIVLELEEDLETIMEGRPWLFLKSIILFDKLIQPVERSQIIRSEITRDYCQLKINLDVQKLIRQGIFVFIDNVHRSWVLFKYENLSMFCFGCKRMGHGLKDCLQITPTGKSKINNDPLYTLALKEESKLIGKESIKFNAFSKKEGVQCSYTGGNMEQMEGVKAIKEQDSIYGIKKDEKLKDCTEKQVRRLRYFLKQHNPYLVFLMETKLDKQRMEKARMSCGFMNGIDVEAVGSQGGLCLAWRGDIEGFYGSPYVNKMRSSWNLLRKLGQDKNHPWLELDGGREAKEVSEINEAATSYFQELFTSNGVGDPFYILTGIERSISPDINTSLMSSYTAEEVTAALRGMGHTKALGYDGFPAVFFQKY
ncbi:hypothetical protein J1N35_035276, partial [Gossypium stocksii]